MRPLDLMQQLEEGRIDVDRVLAVLGGEAPAAPAVTTGTANDADRAARSARAEAPPAPLDRGIRRSARGRVLLSDVSAPAVLEQAPLALPRIVLEPTARGLTIAAEPRRAIAAEPRPAAPRRIATEGSVDLQPPAAPAAGTQVVRLTWPSPSVAVVALEDSAQRNMFSPDLIRGLQATFAQIRAAPEAKAVVVHGHASWFCSGGTPDTLDEIRRGRSAFTDTDMFRVLLDCEVPTIAAMQGHALGGGLTFGLYADIPLMADHAFYAANFMSHGFTPGVGATFLFPEKLGRVLGSEMLLSARRYRGSELRERGAPVQVVPGAEVIPRALELAKELAEKPVPQLRLLKRRLSQAVRLGVAHAIEEELMMHRIVFRAEGWAP